MLLNPREQFLSWGPTDSRRHYGDFAVKKIATGSNSDKLASDFFVTEKAL